MDANYCIEVELTIAELVASVNTMLAAGYKMVGGPFTAVVLAEAVVCQALVKHTEVIEP